MDDLMERLLPMRELSSAVCAQADDPDTWFPIKGGTGATAKQRCRACPLLRGCREFATLTGQRGIWGASNELDRRAERARRGLAPFGVKWEAA